MSYSDAMDSSCFCGGTENQRDLMFMPLKIMLVLLFLSNVASHSRAFSLRYLKYNNTKKGTSHLEPWLMCAEVWKQSSLGLCCIVPHPCLGKSTAKRENYYPTFLDQLWSAVSLHSNIKNTSFLWLRCQLGFFEPLTTFKLEVNHWKL